MIRRKFVSPISGFPEGAFRENGIHASSFIKPFGEPASVTTRAIAIAFSGD
jgi:hypothetical protein